MDRPTYKIGDLLRVVTDNSPFFAKGSIVRFDWDDGSDCPYFMLVEGRHKSGCDETVPHPCMYYKLEPATPMQAFLITIDSFFAPGTIVVQGQGEDSDIYTVLYGTCQWHNGVNHRPGAILSTDNHMIRSAIPLGHVPTHEPTNKHGWRIGDLAVVTGDEEVFSPGSIIRLAKDDTSRAPYWDLVRGTVITAHPTGGKRVTNRVVRYRNVQRLDPHTTITETYPITAILTPQVTLDGIKPGDAFHTKGLSKAQFDELAALFVAAGMPRDELDAYGHQYHIFDYFGWHPDQGGYFNDGRNCFTRVRTPEELKRTTTHQETTPMSNPFKKGDCVVLNGFRAKPNGVQHYYGTTGDIERAEAHRTVLTVVDTNADGTRVYASIPEGSTPVFHPSELRVALDSEIAKADTPKVPPQPPLAVGSVVKRKDIDVALIVVNPKPDRDGDIRVLRVDDGAAEFTPIVNVTLLGQIMADGDYRPASAAQSQTKPPSEWDVGDVIRLIGEGHPFLTTGREYTIERIAKNPRDVRVRDDDGDLTTRQRNAFTFVRAAA